MVSSNSLGAFVAAVVTGFHVPAHSRRRSCALLATLTSSTEWRCDLSITTGQLGDTDIRAGLTLVFEEEEGYEPPRGTVTIVGGGGVGDNLQPTPLPEWLELGATTRWQLSEDPNDRRDGFWVLGVPGRFAVG